MLKIVKAPNPVLGEKAKPVATIDASILHLIEEMKKTLFATDDPKGVGLAAPQVGKSLQVFILQKTPNSKVETYINPVVVPIDTEEIKLQENETDREKPAKRKKQPKTLEGCLSLPTIWGQVARHKKLLVTFLDEHGKKHTKHVTGFPAIIIQHEYDHLQGVLFPKRVLEQKEKLYKSSKNEKNEDVFEEIEL